MSSCYVKYGPNKYKLPTDWVICLSSLWYHSEVLFEELSVSIEHDYFLKGENKDYWDWMTVICDRSGTERKGDFLVFRNRKANQIHLITVLARIPLEAARAKKGNIPSLKEYLEKYNYDPLKVAIAADKEETMYCGAHGVYRYYSVSNDPTKFCFKKALKDLETTFHGINNAWFNKLRIGLV